jgi:signal recognition particle receptor subunit beta
MAIIDIERDVIVVRIVYDGPPFSGKTTSVHALAKILDKRDTVFSPQEDPLSKTLYFDWMEYCGGFFKGYSISCQIISVPGQLSLMERRHFLLRTADSVVFVLDASETNTEIALTYFNDLQRLLSPEDHHFVQVIIQANKQDKPKAWSASQLKQTLFPDYPNLKIVDSAAISGKGIREAFVLAVRLALERAEALMVKGQLDHGHPQIDSGEDLFTQLQKDLFFQTIPLKSEATTLVKSNSAAQTELVATNIDLQSDESIITEESTPEIDIAYGAETQLEEQLDSEPTVLFEQLDNNHENFITDEDSITALESAESITKLTEITTTLPPIPNDIEINDLPLESVNLFEPLAELETTEDEWNEELVEPLLGTEAFTEEEEKFFNQLIASSQVAEEEIEEDLEEPFYPLESAGATFTTVGQLTEKPIILFDDLDESESTAMAGLSLELHLPTTTEVGETSHPSTSLESKTFEDLAADDFHPDLSTATNELLTSTPVIATTESPSLLEPPLIKDWMELDDSKSSESLEPLPAEPTITESMVSAAIEPLTSGTPPAIEPPLVKDWMELDDSKSSESLELLPIELTTTESVVSAAVEEGIEFPLLSETQESIENLAERDHSEGLVVAKEEIDTVSVSLEITPLSVEPALSPTLPLFPDENLSTQWIWPPLAGRTWVKTIFHLPIKNVQESNGIWIIEAEDKWLGFSKAEWLYHDVQLAKQTLHDHIRMHLQCSPLLSEKRAIVIATDEKSWRLWQLVQLETTLATHLLMALQEKTMDKLALEVFRCVSHYAEVYLRCAQYPSGLDLNLENVGSNQERQLIYLGIIDFISPMNERTQAGLLDSIKQLLTEPIKPAKANLDVTAIVNELEKIDGFGQQYLLETLIQLFHS